MTKNVISKTMEKLGIPRYDKKMEEKKIEVIYDLFRNIDQGIMKRLWDRTAREMGVFPVTAFYDRNCFAFDDKGKLKFEELMICPEVPGDRKIKVSTVNRKEVVFEPDEFDKEKDILYVLAVFKNVKLPAWLIYTKIPKDESTVTIELGGLSGNLEHVYYFTSDKELERFSGSHYLNLKG